jgi:hypothetical protein
MGNSGCPMTHSIITALKFQFEKISFKGFIYGKKQACQNQPPKGRM